MSYTYIYIHFYQCEYILKKHMNNLKVYYHRIIWIHRDLRTDLCQQHKRMPALLANCSFRFRCNHRGEDDFFYDE